MVEQKKFADRIKDALKGTNFWVALCLFVLTLFGSVSGEAVQGVVLAASATIAAFFAIRVSFKYEGFDPLKRLKDGNFINYLSVILLSFFPELPGSIFESINDLLRGIFSQNWQLVVAEVIQIVTILYYLFNPKTKTITSLPGKAPGTQTNI